MIVPLIVLAVLLLLLLLPLGGAVRYDREGFSAWVTAGPLRLKLYPVDREKQAKKEKKPKKRPKPKPETEKAPPTGGKLELVQAALPLVKPALAGLKRRLTIRELELLVTWTAADPADAAVGYGCANGALGILWAVVDENFKVKRSRLGCQVDYDAQAPTVYLNAVLTTNLWHLATLALPLLLRFLSDAVRLRGKKSEITKKEA